MKFSTAYNHKLEKATPTVGKSLCDMSQAEFCKLKNMVSAGNRRSNFEDFEENASGLNWGDNTREYSLSEIYEFGSRVDSDFNKLPIDVKKQFDNKPIKYLEFMKNPDNYLQAFEMGILSPDYLSSNQRVQYKVKNKIALNDDELEIFSGGKYSRKSDKTE